MNHRNMKIVADSSADLLGIPSLPYACAPLKIIAGEQEYVDNAQLDVIGMVNDLTQYTGRSSTACPSVGDWLDAFGDAPYVFCVTITSGLSGSYNAAVSAKEAYEEENPDRKVFVIDSLSAGPELRLIIEKLAQLIGEVKDFDTICQQIKEYQKHTGLLFKLESVKNLANNGRVSKLVAGAVGILGIRLVGKASDEGTLEVLHKVRGEKKALAVLMELMEELGYKGGKLRISHCINGVTAREFKERILEKFPHADVELYACRGLVAFYAEKGGLLFGFEKG